jgi:hypothetical protein
VQALYRVFLVLHLEADLAVVGIAAHHDAVFARFGRQRDADDGLPALVAMVDHHPVAAEGDAGRRLTLVAQVDDGDTARYRAVLRQGQGQADVEQKGGKN